MSPTISATQADRRYQALDRVLSALGCHHIGRDPEARAIFFRRPQAQPGDVGLIVLATGDLHRYVILLDAGPRGIAVGSAASLHRCERAVAHLWGQAEAGWTLHLIDLDTHTAASRRR